MIGLTAIKPETRSSVAWGIRDSLVLIKRSMMHIIKNPDQLLAVAFQPIMFMLLFRYVFGGAIATGGSTYVNFLVAGILVQSSGFGSTTTAIAVANDLQKGIVDRFRSLPMMSSALLIGHTVSDLARNTISAMVMIGVGLLVGFRPTASFVEWLGIAGILLLFTFAFSWMSAIMGMVAKSPEAVQWISFIFIFPLTFASSAFVPAETMAPGLRAFAVNQPVTHVIGAMRSLMVGEPAMGDHAWLAVIWCLGILAVCIPLSTVLFRRRTSR